MKLGMHYGLVAIVALGGLATACGSSSSDAPSGPVAAKPLAGTVDGKDFSAKSAIARKGFDEGKKSIDIYDTDVSCDDFSPKADREILIDVPWTAGTAKDFSFSLGGDGQTATFVLHGNDNIIATQGRVEIVDAPADKGSTGKIRLRADAEGNNVEGEIAVKVCE